MTPGEWLSAMRDLLDLYEDPPAKFRVWYHSVEHLKHDVLGAVPCSDRQAADSGTADPAGAQVSRLLAVQ